jgi:hypothetical protein
LVALGGDLCLVFEKDKTHMRDLRNQMNPDVRGQTSVDLLDPATGEFQALPPIEGFSADEAVALPGGKAWLFGQKPGTSAQSLDRLWAGEPASRIFDSHTGSFSQGPVGFPRHSWDRAALDQDRILFYCRNGTGIFNLKTGTFTSFKGFPDQNQAKLVPLADGRFLVVGGRRPFPELLDPTLGCLVPVPEPPRLYGRARALWFRLFPVTPLCNVRMN